MWRSWRVSCIGSRRRSSMRWRSRSSSSTSSPSSIANGGVGDSASRSALDDRELDLARGDLRVDRALLAAHDLALDADHVLGAQRAGQRVRLGRRLGVEDELEHAAAVAQVDEDQAAEVAAARDPARDPDGLARPLGVELARPGVAVGVRARRPHRPPRMWCITVSGSTVFCSPDCMSFSDVPSSPRMATYRAPVRSACLSWPFSERPPSSSLAAWPARRASAASRNAASRCSGLA